ncbi:MAG: hypothetical protein AAF485_26350, partial [Chloroflexota bacterium]
QLSTRINWALVSIAIYPIIFGIFMTVGVLKRDWYLMPAFPALDILGASGLVWLGQQLIQRFDLDNVSSRVWGLGIGGILILQLLFTLPSHPLYYTYWNPLINGGSWASDAVMVGWDLDLGMGAHYLNEKPDPETLKAAIRTSRGFREIFMGQTISMAIDANWIEADYLLVRQTHRQLNKHDPWELYYLNHLRLDKVITIEGVDYLWVYEAPHAQYAAGPSQLVGKGILFGYDLSATTLEVGQPLTLGLFWLNQGVTKTDTFFVRLVDANGYIWSETAAETPAKFQPKPDVIETMTESSATLDLPVGIPPGRYTLQMGFFNQIKQEEIGQFTLPDSGKLIEVIPSIQSLPLPTLDQPLNSALTEAVTLLGVDNPFPDISIQDENALILYWQAQAPIDQDLVIALQLFDAQKQEVATWIQRPANSNYTTDQWQTGDLIKDPWSLSISGDQAAMLSPGDYQLSITLYDSQTNQPVGSVDLGPVTVVDRRRQFEPPSLQNPLQAQFGDTISLIGYDLFEEPLLGGARTTLKLYWQARQEIPESYTVFVQILGPQGTVVGQHDSIPAGYLETNQWLPQEIVTDRHQIDFPTEELGEYRLIVGMYQPETGERLPITQTGQEASTDFLQLHTFQVSEGR